MCRTSVDSKTKLLLQQRAQLMRANPSHPERVFWKGVRLGQLGVPFRRQVVIGRFIVDFLAPQAKLIVDVDGPQHERRRSADARRDHKPERCGGCRPSELKRTQSRGKALSPPRNPIGFSLFRHPTSASYSLAPNRTTLVSTSYKPPAKLKGWKPALVSLVTTPNASMRSATAPVVALATR